MSIGLNVVLRLSLATLLGSLIGLNRDLRGKPAGLRTHALVALGSALIVVICGQLPGAEGAHAADAQSRAIQGLITGIGFLGAGVILHNNNEKRVHGLTTAATLWVATVFGAACGAGLFVPALIAFVLLALVLMFGGKLEHAIHHWLHPDPDDNIPPNS